MNKHRNLKKLLAIICVITVLFSLVNLQTLAETGYTELTFADYGIEDGKYVVGNCLQKKPVQQISGLNGVAFNGKVKFESGCSINDGLRIGGIQNGWEGVFGVFYSDGGIYLWDYMKTGASLYHVPVSMLRVNPLEDEVSVRMTFDYVGSSDVRLTFSINGRVYYDETLAGYQSLLGTFLMVSATSVPVTVKSTDIEEIENIYTEITFSDFGVSDGTHKVGDSNVQKIASGIRDLDKVIFVGKMMFAEGQDPYNNCVRIGGIANGWPGLGIFYADNGIYLWDHIITGHSIVHVPISKLTVNPLEEFVTVKLAFRYVGTNDVELTFSIDGYSYVTTLQGYKSRLGTYMLVAATTAPISLESVKTEKESANEILTDLPEITPLDFGVANNNYTYTDSNSDGSGEASVDGKLKWNYYLTDSLDSVVGKTFSTNVKFGGKDEQLRIGGTDNSQNRQWSGIIFAGTEKGFYIKETEGAKSFGKQVFDIETAGLSSATEQFNLKMSFEARDHDGDGIKDDLKLGVWFNNRLYNNTYLYIEGYASYLGNYMLIYCPNKGGTLKVSSDYLTPYIVEDFGIREQNICAADLDGESIYVKLLEMELEGSSISGMLALSEEAKVYLYGQEEQPLTGCQFYLANGKLRMKVAPLLDLELCEMKDGELFSFMVSEKKLDADADGCSDDIRLGIYINGSMYQNRYWYLFNYASQMEGTFAVHVSGNDEVLVKDSVNRELCNLANVDDKAGYLVNGEGSITANGKVVQSGEILETPGDYIIRCVGEGTYVKQVSIYQSGDAHADGSFNTKDLVAVKKAMTEIRLSTKAGEEGADANRDAVVDRVDFSKLQEQLTGKVDMTLTADNYLTFEEDVMPIVGYFGPYRTTAVATEHHEETYYDYVIDDIYQKIQAVGVNLIGRSQNDYLGANDKEQILDGLALAQKYGIGVLVSDERLKDVTDGMQLSDAVSEFAKYSSYKGVSVVDEPFTSYYGSKYYQKGERRLETYTSRSTLLNTFFNTFGYMNLNGMGKHLADEHELEEMYDKYLEEYITTCNPKMISWDYYVFDEEIYGKNHYWTTEGYFKNLRMMRNKSLKYNLPFWSYVQAGSNWRESTTDDSKWITNDNVPTKGQMLWNVNTALAYGAKGIQYFPLIQPYWFAYGGLADDVYDNFERNGLIAADGSTTKWYDYAQEANSWITMVDEVLMNAVSKEVLVVGETAQQETGILNRIQYGELEEIAAVSGTLVGVFSYQGKTVYYVVNYDTEHSQNITLRWNTEKQYTCYIQGVPNVVNETSDVCQLSLGAGNAALVTINE